MISTRKSAISIAVLFVFGLSAFAATSASASGATTYTCVKDSGGTLFGSHCLKDSSGDKYTHVAFSEATTATATNANTASNTVAAAPFILKYGTFPFNVVEVRCSEVHGEGTAENKTVEGEMRGHLKTSLHYTGCAVKAPSEKGCKIPGEAINTNQLAVRSVGGGETVKIEPEEGLEKIAEFTIEGCSIAAFNTTYPVTGSFEAKTNGATVTTTHNEVTAQGILMVKNMKAGIESALTFKAHSKAGEETKPLALTGTA
ncbi:MAG TPA: hypothetical protein VFJ57_06535 [Solirubrobacterales bacterium]|nr:hypothetical protein [Solirubrobacterales bacterium]